MGKIIDKILLKPEKLDHFLAVHKNNKNSHQYQPYQNRKDQYHHPGFIGQNFFSIQMKPADNHFQARAHLDIPVNIQE